jgi:hypothetical protein
LYLALWPSSNTASLMDSFYSKTFCHFEFPFWCYHFPIFII